MREHTKTKTGNKYFRIRRSGLVISLFCCEYDTYPLLAYVVVSNLAYVFKHYNLFATAGVVVPTNCVCRVCENIVLTVEQQSNLQKLIQLAGMPAAEQYLISLNFLKFKN